MIDFCLGAGLRIGGSWFQRKDIHRMSWYSNDGHTRKDVDHVFVGTRWRLLQNCRVRRGMAFDSDHRTVVARLDIRFGHRRRGPPPRPRLDGDKLWDPSVARAFTSAVAGG